MNDIKLIKEAFALYTEGKFISGRFPEIAKEMQINQQKLECLCVTFATMKSDPRLAQRMLDTLYFRGPIFDYEGGLV